MEERNSRKCERESAVRKSVSAVTDHKHVPLKKGKISDERSKEFDIHFLKVLRDPTAYETFVLEVSRTHQWSTAGQVCDPSPTGMHCMHALSCIASFVFSQYSRIFYTDTLNASHAPRALRTQNVQSTEITEFCHKVK